MKGDLVLLAWSFDLDSNMEAIELGHEYFFNCVTLPFTVSAQNLSLLVLIHSTNRKKR